MLPEPFSVYIHVPFCRRRCAYCSFVSYAGRESDIPAYVRALTQEIRLRRIEGAEVGTLYFGGGTPSLLPPESVASILREIRKGFVVLPQAEITLEANPCTVSLDYLRDIRSAGVNRLSLGVQSLDDAELRLLGRIHTATEALVCLEQSRRAGFENINLDFIYGVPGRRPETWSRMLERIAGQGACHFSFYGLTLEEDTPLFAAVSRGTIAATDEDAQAEEYETAEQMLEGAGYRHYEISNWALPGYESRHNLNCWKRRPYLGLGVAAHSFLDSQRIANTSGMDDYLWHLSAGKLPPRSIETIDEATALSETVILGLRLAEGVSADDIAARFGIDLYSRFAVEIAELAASGLLAQDGRNIRLTPRGRLLGNEVFLRFIA